ncbi:hypothetical protein [Streptomyces sp. AC495_CC817]|uniref:hypothetical protein n=1 Tax=Streptomyces sp. AC495_CC817 TaxID=2823900 RepID=UPI001C26C828|nr:hypothetical protein [Streptomyces sp. AC495_CC817]
MAVATQEVFQRTDALCEVWDAGSATPQYTLLMKGGRPGVTLTDTKGVAKPDQVLYGAVKVTGITQPGYSNEAAKSVSAAGFGVGVATDGTWEFPSVVSTGTTPAPTSTAQGTPVFVTGAGALTLESSGNTRVGAVNYTATYVKSAGTLPIKIGV